VLAPNAPRGVVASLDFDPAADRSSSLETLSDT